MAERPGVAFGVALRASRERQDMTQLELAVAAGLHPTHISLLERGLREPRFDTVVKLAHALSTADLYTMGAPPEQPLGRTLHTLRRTAGYTQTRVAVKAGISVGAYGRIERGESDPTWATVLRIARALRAEVRIVPKRD
jgi:transcriptional regulator with XRE-family HTH domain